MAELPKLEMKPVHVSDDILERMKKLPTATIYSGTRRFGSPECVCEGLINFTPGKRMAARAKTLKFLPTRADIFAETKIGADSPEYIAMGRCGPGDVLVADLMGLTRDVVAGDVKLLQLAMNKADGIVIDGAIRDLDVMRDEDYGLTVYAKSRSFHGNPVTVSAEENVQIQCGGALVRPGDILVGDDDGVLVVASWMAEAVLQWAEDHEGTENYIKEKIKAEKVAPGKYYPPTDEMVQEWLRVKKERGL